MARKRGRPADDQHLRMRRLLGALANQERVGLPRTRLQRAMGLDGPNAERVFRRDLANLRKAGWDIRSATVGGQHLYVLHVIDPRIRRAFTDQERAELLRAARRAGLGQLYEDLDPEAADGTRAAEDDQLGQAQEAIATRCLVRFTYKGKPRVVHPYELARGDRGWLLRGREEGAEPSTGDVVKVFYVNQATDLGLDHPGTAEPPPDRLPPLNLDPMRWEVHPPIEVILETTDEALDDVIALLGGRGYEVVLDRDLGAVRIEVTVTFMDGFLSRLFELGTRVRLIGPPEVRDAARQRLTDVIGGPR